MSKEKIYLKIDPVKNDDFVLIRENGAKLIGEDAGKYIKEHHNEIKEAILIPFEVPNFSADIELGQGPFLEAQAEYFGNPTDEFNTKGAADLFKTMGAIFEYLYPSLMKMRKIVQ